MFVTSYSVTYCIYIPGKPEFFFHYYCTLYDEFKQSDTFWLTVRIRLFVNNIISLSSLCKLIWRHWTYKMPVRYILSSVWMRLSIFSQLSLYNIWGCVFSVYPSPLWWLREYILCLIIIKSEVWTITHFLGLGHETMICAVCFYILMNLWYSWIASWDIRHWWYLPWIWPSVTNIHHYYHARYPTDDWHLAYVFTSIFFRRSVPGRRVSPSCKHRARSLCQGLCTPHAASPLTRKQNRRGDPALYLSQVRGHRTGIWVCLHYWVEVWVAGYFDFPLYCAVYGVCHRQDTLWS